MLQVHTPSGQGIEVESGLTTIWRFMRFAEFTSLLLNGLYFSSCTNHAKGDDPWEGQVPAELLDWIKEQRHPPYPGNHRRFDDYWTFEQQRHFLSCWYLGSRECYAMWKVHGGMDAPVAVQSTVERFGQAIAARGGIREIETAQLSHIVVGQVKYLTHAAWRFENYPSADVHIAPYFLKRPNFAFEREFRAMIDGAQFSNEICNDMAKFPGLNVSVDLNKLIENVVVGPGQDEWIVDVVKSLMTKLGFDNVDRMVRPSELDAKRLP